MSAEIETYETDRFEVETAVRNRYVLVEYTNFVSGNTSHSSYETLDGDRVSRIDQDMFELLLPAPIGNKLARRIK